MSLCLSSVHFRCAFSTQEEPIRIDLEFERIETLHPESSIIKVKILEQ